MPAGTSVAISNAVGSQAVTISKAGCAVPAMTCDLRSAYGEKSGLAAKCGFPGFLMAGKRTPISGKPLKSAGTDEPLHPRYPWVWDFTDCWSPAGFSDLSSRSRKFWISGRWAPGIKAECAEMAIADAIVEGALPASLRV